MSVAVGSGYTLHYFDEAKGEHVSVPLKSLDHLRVQVHETGGVVTYDELGTFTREDVERLAESPDVKDRRIVALIDVDYATIERRLLAHALHDPRVLEASFDLVSFDERALKRAFCHDVLPEPVPDLRSQRRDWHDRGRQHRNRKRRSWR